MMRIAKLAVAATLFLLSGSPLAAQLPGSPAPASTKGLHLVLNVPGRKLHVYEDGVRTRTFTVSIGLPGYETPAGEYRLTEVAWNPWWHPPASDWARGRKPAPPGAPDNPMGRVKLLFGPLLYIHGTPEGEPVGRLASRGCVRMRNADVMELAMLVHRYATPNFDRRQLERLAASPKLAQTITLREPVRFTAHYTVAAVEKGFLIIYPDVYGLVKSEVREQVERVLVEHGVDLAQVNHAELRRLVRNSGPRRLAIAIDTLLAPVPAPVPLGTPVQTGG